MKIIQESEYDFQRGERTQERIGLCDSCGREVVLSGFTNTCDCGADYNMNGTRLASRSFWGEETGESLCDIMCGGPQED